MLGNHQLAKQISQMQKFQPKSYSNFQELVRTKFVKNLSVCNVWARKSYISRAVPPRKIEQG